MGRFFHSTDQNNRDSIGNELLKEVGTRLPGQNLIQKNQIRTPTSQLEPGFDRIGAGAGDFEFRHAVNELLHEQTHFRDVFDNQNGCFNDQGVPPFS